MKESKAYPRGIFALDLTPAARMVLALLWSYADIKRRVPFVFPSVDRLVFITGMSKRSVLRHLKDLQEAGAIRRRGAGWRLKRFAEPKKPTLLQADWDEDWDDDSLIGDEDFASDAEPEVPALASSGANRGTSSANRGTSSANRGTSSASVGTRAASIGTSDATVGELEVPAVAPDGVSAGAGGVSAGAGGVTVGAGGVSAGTTVCNGWHRKVPQLALLRSNEDPIEDPIEDPKKPGRAPDPAIEELIDRVLALMQRAVADVTQGQSPGPRNTPANRKLVREATKRERATLQDWQVVIEAQTESVRSEPDNWRWLTLATICRARNWARLRDAPRTPPGIRGKRQAPAYAPSVFQTSTTPDTSDSALWPNDEECPL